MKKAKTETSRRNFIKLAGAGLAASALQVSSGAAFAHASEQAPGQDAVRKETPSQKDPVKIGGKGYNVVLIVTDQERYFKEYPESAQLDSREKMRNEGVSFENHYNCSNMCTSSRSVMYTGQHVQHTGMFDNTNLPWQPDMSTDIPTVGDRMRELGYYTAYKGKVHLSEAIMPEANTDHKLMTDAMEPYGFSDFNPTGDHYGKTLGGYTHDTGFAGDAVNWLRSKGTALNEEGKPFFLAVNMINPHDVMYFDTDAKGEDAQQYDENEKILVPINRAPDNTVYASAHEDFPLPANLYQPIREKGRPKAHYEYFKGWDFLCGVIPDKDANWTRYKNYYLNCLKDVDMQIGLVLDALEKQGMRDNTVIVFTADHGEMCGNHHLRGKGPFAYDENIHVPMIILHPEIDGGQSTHAVTSHLDLTPTLLSLTGVASKDVQQAGKGLHGKDMSSVLADPAGAGLTQIRPAALHCFDMICTVDGDFLQKQVEAVNKGENWEAMKSVRPDLSKRGNIRIMFDGRYKYARYFAPLQRNTPTTFEELTKLNELELYDHKTDPQEMHNLAMDLQANKELIMRLNAKMNELIAAEVGEDVGPELQDYDDWNVKDWRH